MRTLLSKQLTYTFAAAALLMGTVAMAEGSKHTYQGAMKAIPHATISFEKGSSLLNDTDKTALRNLIESAKAAGTIEQVTVAAWSDKALPIAKGAKLSETDRGLAKARLDAINAYLKDTLAMTDVDTYNMAEDSNWLAKTFRTSDAELKSLFSKKGAEPAVTNAEFHVIKNEGGPSEAVVVVERELGDDSMIVD